MLGGNECQNDTRNVNGRNGSERKHGALVRNVTAKTVLNTNKQDVDKMSRRHRRDGHSHKKSQPHYKPHRHVTQQKPKTYTLSQKLKYRMKKLNKGFERKLKQTEKNARIRRLGRERERHIRRREEAITQRIEREHGVEPPTTAERVFDRDAVALARKAKETLRAKSNVDPVAEGGEYLNNLMFGGMKKKGK